jgi:hypothetical protein
MMINLYRISRLRNANSCKDQDENRRNEEDTCTHTKRLKDP